MQDRMTHLQRLEAEAIHIMREVVAEAENPVMLYSIEKILQKHPNIDSVLPTMGGQTALNLAIKCDELGIWEINNVKMIGVNIDAIDITENREAFRLLMGDIGVPMAPQAAAKSFLEGKEVAQRFGFPLCVRASYTLGTLARQGASGAADTET